MFKQMIAYPFPVLKFEKQTDILHLLKNILVQKYSKILYAERIGFQNIKLYLNIARDRRLQNHIDIVKVFKLIHQNA